MNRYSYGTRLILMASILSCLALTVFAHERYHWMLDSFAIVLFVSGITVLYLQKTGRIKWNGPNWGARLNSSPAGRRVLMVIPMLCAAAIPILLLLNRRWGLSDAQVSGACGALLGISFVMVAKLRSRTGLCCEPLPESQTQQSGTK